MTKTAILLPLSSTIPKESKEEKKMTTRGRHFASATKRFLAPGDT